MQSPAAGTKRVRSGAARPQTQTRAMLSARDCDSVMMAALPLNKAAFDNVLKKLQKLPDYKLLSPGAVDEFGTFVLNVMLRWQDMRGKKEVYWFKAILQLLLVRGSRCIAYTRCLHLFFSH